MITIEKIIIVGAGGLGREILANISNTSLSEKYEVIGFVDDALNKDEVVNNKNILGNLNWLMNQNSISVILAIGNPQIRRKIYNILSVNENIKFPTIIHPTSTIQDIENCTIGKGCFVGQNVILTTNVTIEDFCLLNIGCSLHHDTIIKSFSVIMPGVRITGGATIGEASYLGPNIAIAKKIHIESDSVIN